MSPTINLPINDNYAVRLGFRGRSKGGSRRQCHCSKEKGQEISNQFDLTKQYRFTCNKKALENLILAGGFDSFWEFAVSIFS
jgi:DNA polymerase-3 subunit alpha